MAPPFHLGAWSMALMLWLLFELLLCRDVQCENTSHLVMMHTFHLSLQIYICLSREIRSVPSLSAMIDSETATVCRHTHNVRGSQHNVLMLSVFRFTFSECGRMSIEEWCMTSLP